MGKTEEAAAILKDYNAGKRKYRELKEVVANALVELTWGLRARREEILKDAASVKLKTAEMVEKARTIAASNLKEVRSIIGLPERTS